LISITATNPNELSAACRAVHVNIFPCLVWPRAYGLWAEQDSSGTRWLPSMVTFTGTAVLGCYFRNHSSLLL
jgi:hypothetical protein